MKDRNETYRQVSNLPLHKTVETQCLRLATEGSAKMDYGEEREDIDYIDGDGIDYKWDEAISVSPNRSKSFRQINMPDYSQRNTLPNVGNRIIARMQ